MGTVVSAHEVSVQFDLDITLRKPLKLTIYCPKLKDMPILVGACRCQCGTEIGCIQPEAAQSSSVHTAIVPSFEDPNTSVNKGVWHERAFGFVAGSS